MVCTPVVRINKTGQSPGRPLFVPIAGIVVSAVTSCPRNAPFRPNLTPLRGAPCGISARNFGNLNNANRLPCALSLERDGSRIYRAFSARPLWGRFPGPSSPGYNLFCASRHQCVVSRLQETKAAINRKNWPVIQSAAGSASEMIQLETSFGWQRRPKGMRSLSWRLTASACSVESPIMGGRSRTNADNGPKGQENIAQALAWVGQRKDVKPCKGGRTHAPINFRHSICQKERYVVSHFRSASSRPYRAITVGGELPRLEAWAKFPRPFGPKQPPRDRTTHGGRRMIAPKHCRQTR